MTTDTASVDALRTRLARAFEVAALRDPSAELAAFEAAVRESVLKQAAIELRRCAGERFDAHGGHDVRGAAIWDSAAHIDPNEGQWSPPP